MRIVPRRSTLALLAAAATALAAPAAASAAEGQIIVKYAASADAADRADARADADVVAAGSLPLAHTQLVAPEPGTSVSEAVADLERSPEVAYAEPDQERTAAAAPNDPSFGWQWSLQNTGSIFNRRSTRPSYIGTAGDDVDVLPAWDLGVTSSDVTVGVVDSGVDLAHPDLAANLLATGHDYVDGDSAPLDQNGHGTHVAGIIGAVGNNGIGVTGIAWKAHILPVRVLNASGSGSVSTVINGYTYAATHGARIVNVSLGGDSPSQAEYDALRNASSTLFVVAAGNGSANVDTTDSYPCAYNLPNVLCVAATGADDQLASFSDYGAQSVDLAAPGVDILSTYPTALSTDPTFPYKWLSGTSMATPEVAGAAALVLGQNPSLTPWQLREKLTTSVDRVPALAGKVASGGRLDVANALALPAPTDSTPVASAIAPAARVTTPTTTTTPTTPTAPASPATPATPAPVAAQPAPAAPSAPAPSTPTTTPADHTAPAVGLSLATRSALTALLKGRLQATATVSERASVQVELRLDARSAKKLHLRASTAGVRIATSAAGVTGAGSARVALRLTSAARRALARVRSVRATLAATATDAAGNRGARSLQLTIRR